jgi:hypothetical protein
MPYFSGCLASTAYLTVKEGLQTATAYCYYKQVRICKKLDFIFPAFQSYM